MSRFRKIITALVALAVLVVGAFALWIFVLRDDAPDALGSGDLDAALGTTTVAVVETAAPTTAGTATTAPPTTAAATADDPSGTWTAIMAAISQWKLP